jgi:hypothetical protein
MTFGGQARRRGERLSGVTRRLPMRQWPERRNTGRFICYNIGQI